MWIVRRVAAEHRAEFFAGVQEHSQIKLRALERYLPPWSAKVGSQRGVNRVWVVDGFAGPGRYGSGQPGSPSITLRHAEERREAGARYKVSCIFVEKRAALFQRLRTVCSEYPEIETFPLKGDFWEQIEKVGDLVGDDPALVFLDPFGLKDLKFDLLAELCNRLPNVDLMLNFASPAARRLEKNNSELVSAAAGGDGWTTESLTQIFCDRLQAACRFLKPAVLPVVATIGGKRLKYEIVLAARDRAAYELWNDEIASSQRQILDGDDRSAKQELIDSAREMLRSFAPATFTRDELIKRVQFERCGQFHARVFRAAVKAMLDEGEWKRDSGPVGTARMWKVSL